MIKEIKMPDLGTTTNEIVLMRWLKGEGETVRLGESLFVVETDKSTMDVEAYLAGELKKIVVREGETVETGTVVAYIGDVGDTLEDIC